MGNSESVAITIQIDGESHEKTGQPVAQAGQRLQGEVVVTVKKMVDSAPIKLIISGKEKSGLKVRKREQMVFTDAERRFFSVTIPLRSFQDNRRVAPGEYSFPFAITLPRSLPATDKHPMDRRRGKIGYQIEYRMTAKMGMLFKELYFDVISAPLPSDKIPCLIRPTQHRIQSLGLTEDGQVILGAMVNNSVVGRGKNVELFLACRNDSTVNIRCVEIQIVEFLRWTLGPKPETMDAHKVLKTIKSVSLPATCKAKKSSETGKTSIAVMYREIHDELETRSDPILINIPDSARDTYKGRLVSVWHCLKIRFVTRAISTDATAIVPIQIGTPPVRQSQPRPKHPKTLSQSSKKPVKALTQSAPPRMAGERRQDMARPVPVPVATSLPPLAENGPEYLSNTLPVVIAPDDLIILGAAAINLRDSRGDGSDVDSVVTAPPEQAIAVQVSLRSLLISMESAVNDYDLIFNYLMQRSWVKLFGRMSPSEYGLVVGAVKVEVDQPRVAAMLAPHVNGGNCFTCEYAAAAVRNCSDSYRSLTTKRLLPICVDIKQKHKLILNELNEWERIATKNEFESALLPNLAPSSGQL